MEDYKIEIFMTPHNDNEVDKPYFWAIMMFQEISWSNTGVCGWAQSPSEAWAAAEKNFSSLKEL